MSRRIAGTALFAVMVACGKDPAPPKPGPTVSADAASDAVIANDAAVDAAIDAEVEATADDEAIDDSDVDLSSRTITDDSFGPITTDTEATPMVLAKLVPELTWEDVTSGDAEGGTVLSVNGRRPGSTAPGDRFELQPSVAVMRNDQSTEVYKVTAYDATFTTASGVKVGDTVATVLRKYPDLTCEVAVTELVETGCTTTKLERVEFHVESLRGATDGPVSPRKLSKQAVRAIHWR